MAKLQEFLEFDIDLSKSAAEADALIRRYREIGRSIGAARVEVERLKTRQLELLKLNATETDKGVLGGYAKDLKLVNAELRLAKESVARLSTEQRGLNSSFKAAAPAVGTYAELAARLKQLQFERINLAPIGSERFVELTRDIEIVNNQLKQLDSQVGVFGRNVGNYRNDIIRAFQDFGFDGLVKEQIGVLKKEFKLAKDEATRLVKEYNDATNVNSGKLEGEIKDLRNELQNAVGRAAALDRELRNIDRNSLDGIKRELKEAFSFEGLLRQGTSIAIGNLAVDSILQASGRALDFLREISKVEGNIARLNDKLSESDVKDIINDLRTLDTTTGLADLGRIAALSGQFGVAKKEVRGFVSAVDAVNVALGDEFGNDVDNVTRQVGKLAVLYGDATRSIGENTTAVGSLLNETSAKLDNVTAAFEADFALRLSSTAAKFKLSLGEIAGIGAVLEQSGMRAESAGTATAKTFNSLVTNSAMYAKELGFSNEETATFARLLDTDVNEALVFFLKQLNFANKSTTERAALMKRLKITDKEESDVLVSLATNLKSVERNQLLASDAMRDGTSIGKEFGKSLNTLDGLLLRLKNRLLNVLGDPAIVSGLESIASGVLDFVDELLFTYNKVVGVFQSIKDSIKSVDDFLRKSGSGKRSILPDDMLALDDEQVKKNAERARKTYGKLFNDVSEDSKKAGRAVADNLGSSFKNAQSDFDNLLLGKPVVGSRSSRSAAASGGGGGVAAGKAVAAEKLSTEQKLIDEIGRLREKETRNELARQNRLNEQAAERNAKRVELELESMGRLSEARSAYQSAILDSERRFDDAFVEIANERDRATDANRAEADALLAEYREQLRERVLSQQQYEKLSAELAETFRLKDLAAEAEYQQSLLGLEEAKRERIVESRKALSDELLAVRSAAGDLLGNDERLQIELELLDAGFTADLAVAEASLSRLQTVASLNPADEGAANELNAAIARIEALKLSLQKEKSSVLSDILLSDLDDAEVLLERRFSGIADALKVEFGKALAGVSGGGAAASAERASLGDTEQGQNLVLEASKLEAQKQLYLQYLSDLKVATGISAKDREAIERDLAEKIAAIDGSLAENYRQMMDSRVELSQQAAARREEIESAVLNSIGQLEQAAFQLSSANRDAEYAQLQERLSNRKEQELAVYGTTEARRAAIEESYREKAKVAEKAYREERKQAAITQAIVNGVLAATEIIGTYAANPILMGILLATTAALSAFQVAEIKRQQFRDGGMVGGKGHEAGGTLVEAERGEGVITRRSMGIFGQLASGINESGGGKRFEGFRGLTDRGRAWLKLADAALRQADVPLLRSGVGEAAMFMVHHVWNGGTNRSAGMGQLDLSVVEDLLDSTATELQGLRRDVKGYDARIVRILNSR